MRQFLNWLKCRKALNRNSDLKKSWAVLKKSSIFKEAKKGKWESFRARVLEKSELIDEYSRAANTNSKEYKNFLAAVENGETFCVIVIVNNDLTPFENIKPKHGKFYEILIDIDKLEVVFFIRGIIQI